MSGGSMNYLYSKIEYEARFEAHTPERRAFRKHLEKVSRALKAIEWNDSGDGADYETDAIRDCIGQDGMLKAVTEQAQEAAKVLRAELDRAAKRGDWK